MDGSIDTSVFFHCSAVDVGSRSAMAIYTHSRLPSLAYSLPAVICRCMHGTEVRFCVTFVNGIWHLNSLRHCISYHQLAEKNQFYHWNSLKEYHKLKKIRIIKGRMLSASRFAGLSCRFMRNYSTSRVSKSFMNPGLALFSLNSSWSRSMTDGDYVMVWNICCHWQPIFNRYDTICCMIIYLVTRSSISESFTQNSLI